MQQKHHLLQVFSTRFGQVGVFGILLWQAACMHLLDMVSATGPLHSLSDHGLGVVEVAMLFAPIGAFAGAIRLLGGYYSDKLSQRDVRWNIWLPGLTVFCSVPFSMTVYLVDGPYVALVLSIIPVVLGATYLGPLAITHSLVTPRMRAVASSILFLILNLIGLGIGPWATGLISDLLQPTLGSESLRWALIIVILGNVWRSALLLFCKTFIRRSRAGTCHRD